MQYNQGTCNSTERTTQTPYRGLNIVNLVNGGRVYSQSSNGGRVFIELAEHTKHSRKKKLL